MNPGSHSSYLRDQQVLLPNFYDVDEKLHVLNRLSVSDLKSFIHELFSEVHCRNICHCYVAFRIISISSGICSQCIHSQYLQLYIEGLCHGNLPEEEAISLSNLLKTNFPVQPFLIELMSRDHCICLLDDANLIRDAGVNNKSETNSLIEVTKNGLSCSDFPLYFLCLIYMLILPLVLVSHLQLYYQI